MRYEIRKLHRDLGATSIYVTHDQIEAMTMADRIVAMNDGVAQQIGAPAELYDDPANTFVAGFIGSPAMNFLDGMLAVVDGTGTASVRVGDAVLATIPLPAGLTAEAPVTLGIRPERLRLGAPSTGTAAVVDLMEPTGLASVVHLALGGQAVKLFTTDRLSLAVGEPVALSLAPSDLLLFDPDTGQRLRPKKA